MATDIAEDKSKDAEEVEKTCPTTRNPEQKRRTWQPTLRKAITVMQKKLKRPAQWRTHAVEKAGSKDNEGNNGNTDKNDTQESARATRVARGIHCTVYGAQCTVCGARCTVYGVRCTEYDILCAAHGT